MPLVFVIKNKTGEKFLTSYGWMDSRDQAYKYDLREAADRHLTQNPALARAGATIHAMQWEDSPRPAVDGHAQSEYNPFGYPARE
jgi:hypothetical protein